jgi:hypothetical protein
MNKNTFFALALLVGMVNKVGALSESLEKETQATEKQFVTLKKGSIFLTNLPATWFVDLINVYEKKCLKKDGSRIETKWGTSDKVYQGWRCRDISYQIEELKSALLILMQVDQQKLASYLDADEAEKAANEKEKVTEKTEGEKK